MHIENITEKTWRVRRNRVWRYNGGVDLSMVMHWKSCFVNWDLKLSLLLVLHCEVKCHPSMYKPCDRLAPRWGLRQGLNNLQCSRRVQRSRPAFRAIDRP